MKSQNEGTEDVITTYDGETVGVRPTSVVDGPDTHSRLPQYTRNEVQRAVEVVQLLKKVRDRCREQGLIDW